MCGGPAGRLQVRYIDDTPQGPLASFFHGGFWHTCGPQGCTYVSPTKARPFQNASQAFFFAFLFLTVVAAMILIMAMAAARRKAHSEIAKTAALVYIFAGVCAPLLASASAAPCMTQGRAAACPPRVPPSAGALPPRHDAPGRHFGRHRHVQLRG